MNKKLFFLSLFFMMKFNSSFSQALFAKRIIGGGVSNSQSFIVSPDSNYTIVSIGAEFLRLNKFGDVIPQSYKGYGFQTLFVFDISKTRDSCFLITGNTDDSLNIRRSYIAKTNLRGEVLWVKFANGESILNGMEMSDGNYLAIKPYSDSLLSTQGYIILRIDSSGNYLWGEKIECDFTLRGARPTLDNGFIGVGMNNDKTCVIKVDSVGMISWFRTINDSNIWPMNIIVLSDGNYLVEGRDLQGSTNFYMAKFDTNGILLWYRVYERILSPVSHYVIERANHDLLIVGGSDLGNGFLLNTDSIGIPKFAKSYSALTAGSVHLYSVFESNDRSLTLFGKGGFVSGGDSPFLIKVDSLGEGYCYTIQDSVNFNSPNFSTVSDTFAILPYTTINSLSFMSFSNSLSTLSASDFCTSIGVNEERSSKFVIYPNPVKDKFRFSIPDNFNSSLIEIFNSQGQRISTTNISGDDLKNEISLPNSTPSGKYYGRLISEREVLTFSFMVVK